jgi:hypothetical protein
MHIALLLCVLLSAPAHAGTKPAAEAPAPAPTAETPPTGRVVYSTFLAIRYNPLGLVGRLRAGYRHRLFASDNVLLSDAWFEAGADLTIAPTYVAVGPRLEIKPLAILVFGITYEFIGYFGVLNALMPFSSAQADYWEDTLDDLGKAGRSYGTYGSRLLLDATLQGKVGPIVIRSALRATSLNMDMRAGDTMFYDATNDLLLPDGGWGITNDLDVLGLVGKTILGARYSYADALHGTGGPGDLPTHRVGPAVAYVFHDNGLQAKVNKPTLLLLAQWHLTHPWRAGQRQHQGIPLIALALQWEGELWRKR